MLLPVPVEPAPPKALRRPRLAWIRGRSWPRPRPPGRPQLIALALTLAVIVLAIGVPSPAAAISWLPSPSLPAPSLPRAPSIQLPAIHLPSLRMPSVRLPSIRMPGPPASTPSPRARPTPRPPTAYERYRAAAAAGGVQVDAHIDAVQQGCTAPANLAVCRAALVSLQGSDSQLRTQLDQVGTPPCLGGADPALRKALDDLDTAASQAIGGIDGQDPGRIVTGVQTVGQNRAPLTTALQAVHTAAC